MYFSCHQESLLWMLMWEWYYVTARSCLYLCQGEPNIDWHSVLSTGVGELMSPRWPRYWHGTDNIVDVGQYLYRLRPIAVTLWAEHILYIFMSTLVNELMSQQCCWCLQFDYIMLLLGHIYFHENQTLTDGRYVSESQWVNGAMLV